jgi:hypothetical protein
MLNRNASKVEVHIPGKIPYIIRGFKTHSRGLSAYSLLVGEPLGRWPLGKLEEMRVSGKEVGRLVVGNIWFVIAPSSFSISGAEASGGGSYWKLIA